MNTTLQKLNSAYLVLQKRIEIQAEPKDFNWIIIAIDFYISELKSSVASNDEVNLLLEDFEELRKEYQTLISTL